MYTLLISILGDSPIYIPPKYSSMIRHSNLTTHNIYIKVRSGCDIIYQSYYYSNNIDIIKILVFHDKSVKKSKRKIDSFEMK